MFPHVLANEHATEMALNVTSAQSEDHFRRFSDMNSAYDGFFMAIIGAVIAAVVLVFLCLILVILRYMYRHKGTYHTNEAKGTEFAETADAALRSDPALQDAMDESKKEYFI